ncbi:hypothetical protein BRC68_08220 [Halobacteriales archaeon QH_6_64_20]|nr:MAG: hypothetical protein BRC68_08220 [Halobacteriales archaeon QH_6_64_20]
MSASLGHRLRSIRSRLPSGRTAGRLAFACVVLLASLPLAQGYAIAAGIGEIHPTAPPAENETVIATQPGHLLLYGENGTLRYDEHRYENYWDVDPTRPATERYCSPPVPRPTPGRVAPRSAFGTSSRG